MRILSRQLSVRWPLCVGVAPAPPPAVAPRPGYRVQALAGLPADPQLSVDRAVATGSGAVRREGLGERHQCTGDPVADGSAEQLPAVWADGQLPVGDRGHDEPLHDADQGAVSQLRREAYPVDGGLRPAHPFTAARSG